MLFSAPQAPISEAVPRFREALAGLVETVPGFFLISYLAKIAFGTSELPLSFVLQRALANKQLENRLVLVLWRPS